MADWQSWISLFRSRELRSQKQFAANRTIPVLEHLENRLTPTAPVVLSLSPTSPNLPSTSLSSVTFTAVFNETVTGVDVADFKVTANGSVQTAAPVVVEGSGSIYSITVNGIHGSGGLRLDLVDNDSIVSVNGALGESGVYNGSFQGGSIQILQTFPSVLSIDRTSPASAATNASSVTFTVTFSTDVTGVDAADFAPLVTTGTATGTISQVAPVNASVYTVTVSGIAGEGTLGLKLVANGTIENAAGNPLSASSGPIAYQALQSYATQSTPVGVAFGDVNGDGNADLAVTNRALAPTSSVSVLLGNSSGNGAFQNQQTYETGGLPRAVVVADLNGDGKADLAVANAQSSVGAGVFLGNGDGTFQPQQGFGTGNQPRAIAVGDLNGDGRPDLALANYFGDSVSVLLGTGDGSFPTLQTFATGTFPLSVAIADLNGDGKPDLVTTSFYGTLSVLLGTGAGAFQPQQTFAAGGLPASVAIGDVNADGIPDLALADQLSSTLNVLLGIGNGSFQPLQTFATGNSPLSVALGDVNGDGKIDATVANAGDATIGVLLGIGNGAFLPQQAFATGPNPAAVALGDANGDGKIDLAASSFNSSSVGVLISSYAFVGQAYTIDHLAPTASIVAVSPDPRNTPVGAVTINFNEAVQNFDISDLALTRDGNPVTLSATQLTGTGLQYSLDLSSITSSGANPLVGDYALTLNSSNITDLAGNPLLSGAADSWQIVVFATTTVLVANPNATTGGTLVTFTATVSPSPGALGSVTFKDGPVALAGGSNVALVGGVATFQTSILSVGNHPITAQYNGGPGYSLSASDPASVDVSASAPQLVRVTPNGNFAALAGVQRSRVVSLVVAFNQPVQFDANPMTIVKHLNNVELSNIPQLDGFGSVPDALELSTTDNVTWVVTFSGNTEPSPDSPDGLNSIKDGVYDLNIDITKVHPLGVPGFNMAGNSQATFYRLFGDTEGASTPVGGVENVDFQTIVSTGDNFVFRSSFNNASAYKAYLDFDGDGAIGVGDNFQFRSRFNKLLSWTV